MFNLNDLYAAVDNYAPFSLSEKLIEKGDYDNSGIIVKTHSEVKSVLFSLDLSEEAVKRAESLSVDTVITHHPAIYYPVKNLSVDDKTTSAVIMTAAKGLNVISAHLNMDVAKNGIDSCLALGLGAKEFKIIDCLDGVNGYGREYELNVSLGELKNRIKTVLKTDKFITYDNENDIKKCASFCGGGSGYALDYVKSGKTDADLIITSDMPHHILKELTEYGKSIIILPHYCAEEYGFRIFYERLSSTLTGKVETHYFSDKRFF